MRAELGTLQKPSPDRLNDPGYPRARWGLPGLDRLQQGLWDHPPSLLVSGFPKKSKQHSQGDPVLQEPLLRADKLTSGVLSAAASPFSREARVRRRQKTCAPKSRPRAGPPLLSVGWTRLILSPGACCRAQAPSLQGRDFASEDLFGTTVSSSWTLPLFRGHSDSISSWCWAQRHPAGTEPGKSQHPKPPVGGSHRSLTSITQLPEQVDWG